MSATLNFIERCRERIGIGDALARGLADEVEKAIRAEDEQVAVKVREHPRQQTETWRFKARGRFYYAVWSPERGTLVTLTSPRMRRGKDGKGRRRRKQLPPEAA